MTRKTPTSKTERWEQLRSIGTRLAEDEALSARAAAGDAPELAAELGLDVPPGAKVAILLDSENVKHVVIPAAAANAPKDGELSEAELDSVAGGVSWERFWGTGTSTANDRWNDPYA